MLTRARATFRATRRYVRLSWPRAGAGAAVAVLIMGGCSPPAGGSISGFQDFQIVAYQGEAALGGHNVKFSKAFDQRLPVVLNFWAGQCPPCRAEMPAFQRVADEQQGKVLFVGVDVGPFTGLGSHDDARRLLEELGIRYPAGYAVDASTVRLYNVRSMPTTIFFSRTGERVSTSPGMLTESQLRANVERIIAS